MHRLVSAVSSLLQPCWKWLHCHPLLAGCLLFCCTGCLLAHGSVSLRLVLLLLSGFLLISVMVLSRKFRFLSVCRTVLTGILTGAAVSLLLFTILIPYLESFAGQNVTITGCIRDTVYTTAYNGCYTVQVSDGMPSCRIVLTTMQPDLEEGQVISGEITLRTLAEADDGSFNERSYYLSRGVLLAAEDISCQPTGEIKHTITGVLRRFNTKLSSLFSAHVNGDGLASAVLLGNRDSLSDAAKRDFRRLGILHLLAVSGTHLSILMLVSEKLLIHLRTNRVWRFLLQALLCISYMALTGFSASVTRAGLMHLLLLLCRCFHMKLHYFNALVLSCTVILVISPFAVLDMGLHLSFLSVCGCLISQELQKSWEPIRRFCYGKRVLLSKLSPVRRMLVKLRREVCTSFVMTAVISLLMTPISCLYFGELSLIGFFTGIFYIPAVTLLMYISIFYLLTYPVGLFILPTARLLSLYTVLLLDIASYLSHLPNITLSLAYPFMPVFLVPLSLTVLFLPPCRRKGRMLCCSTALFLAMLTTVGLYHQFTGQNVTVICRNIGKNDGFVLYSGSKVLLADVSDGSYTFTQYLLHEAKSVYATEVDGYLLTHYHNRHIATLEKLSDNWILRKLYLPIPQTEEEQAICSSLTACAERKGIDVIIPDENTVFGDITLLCADRTYLSRSTHPVTSLTFRHPDIQFTYVSSSWNQHKDGAALLTDAQVILFGSHSPIYKKSTDLILTRPELVVWNGDSTDWINIYADTEAVHLYNCRRLVYRFS